MPDNYDEIINRVWNTRWEVAVTGPRDVCHYDVKGPADWKIDSDGHLNITQILDDGTEVTVATHLAGTYYYISQQEQSSAAPEQR